jgi:hypothetical protein
VKPFLNNEYGLKNEQQDCKTGAVREWVLRERSEWKG